MDPLIVFDCKRVLANRFALAVAAAARSRSLNRGAEPRFEMPRATASVIALNEIAQSSFLPGELALFLIEPAEAKRILRANPQSSFAAVAGMPRPHPPPIRRRRFTDDANQGKEE
ncbi:DNA-directed RNA polymerase subunit omega [Rhizobium sp. MC63]|uniref:DNA-directed RNA polymerase subunit omega n=1 Tax=Rhizobium mulingense TaxID=3031128 RepID=A0ACC6N599_9HYPH|nr:MULTISPECIES: DNA-directed RNA polymerase subunit omega [unclassified Rhizobium]MDF0698743.1 DNA-directed RNA polymerase subunit omega [Rhizobium sp. MC63]MEA3520761.1 DNA-directed RNA polymerase subunit omega [Rhizobium sp. MJ31]MEB3045475.1 DNA-directed RNA polymerase subunit omega [Rhizobium sp. MJ21]